MNRLSQRWRWTVPGVVAAAVALVVGVRPVIADASPTLPPRTAAQLLASLPDAASHPFSGTVRTTAHLGLPDLPSSVQGQHAPVSATSLLTGTHTLRVWYAGPDRQRIALVNDLAEADLIHSGQDVWAWNSDTRSGVHLRLPDHQAHGGSTPSGDASPMPHDLMNGLTPQGMAEKLLAAVDPTTVVRVDGTAKVAGRTAYELVVSPRDSRSLVRQIRLAVDSRTSLPLRLQVFSTRSAKPAIQTGFTSIRFATPADSVFRAPDVPLRELTPPRMSPHMMSPNTAPPSTRHPAPSLRPGAPRVHGSGWTAVLELTSVPDLASLAGGPAVAPLRPRAQGKGDTDGYGKDAIAPAGPPDGSAATDSGPGGQAQTELLQSLLRSATPVTGPFGSGRLLRTALVSVLMLDNGHVFVGAVTPATLEQVATSAAA